MIAALVGSAEDALPEAKSRTLRRNDCAVILRCNKEFFEMAALSKTG
jgi:hypothetical protein